MRSSIIGLLLLLGGSTTAVAQRADTALQSTTIEVIQAYKPEVKQVPKPEFQPDLPPRDTSKPAFRFDVPQQALYFTYSSLPLRPLALGKDTTKLPFASYVKLGGGTQSTIYLDADINSIRGVNYETAIHLQHLSQQGNLQNQRMSATRGDASFSVREAKHSWRMAMEALRNRYHFYGYNHIPLDLAADSVRQTYTGVVASLDVKNEHRNRLGIDYHPKFAIDYYTDAYSTRERSFHFDVPFSKTFDSTLTIGAGVRGAFTKLGTTSKDLYNDLVQFTPHLQFKKGNFTGKLGLYPTAGSYYDMIYLPDVYAAYRFKESKLLLNAGWKADLKQNTLRELTTNNPFLFPLTQYPSFRIRQTRSDEVFLGAQTHIGNHLTISGKVSWRQFDNLPLFLNDTLDSKNFYIRYDDRVNAISVEGTVQYQIANRFAAGVTGIFTNFSSKSFERVWHEPGVQIKANAMVKPINDLTITVYGLFMDQLYALDATKQATKLPIIFDMGIGAEYQLIPRLSAFANLNNVLNNRYQRWYRYDVIGINIFGGLRLKF